MNEDLIAFLNDRLDEDEAAAKAAADCDGNLTWFDSRVVASGDHTIRTQPGNRTVARIRRADSDAVDGRTLDPDAVAAHIALNDPARALREVAFKRAILGQYQTVAAWSSDNWPPSLRLLTATWSEHPDYRQEWAL